MPIGDTKEYTQTTFKTSVTEAQEIAKQNSQRTWGKEEAVIIREMVKQEGELINHRITWLVTLQGLLFAALGFAWKDGRELIPILSLLGMLTSASTLSVLILAHRAFESLLKDWDSHKSADYDGPNVIGYRSKSKILMLSRPWFSLPFLFILGWIFVIIVNNFFRT